MEDLKQKLQEIIDGEYPINIYDEGRNSTTAIKNDTLVEKIATAFEIHTTGFNRWLYDNVWVMESCTDRVCYKQYTSGTKKYDTELYHDYLKTL